MTLWTAYKAVVNAQLEILFITLTAFWNKKNNYFLRVP